MLYRLLDTDHDGLLHKADLLAWLRLVFASPGMPHVQPTQLDEQARAALQCKLEEQQEQQQQGQGQAGPGAGLPLADWPLDRASTRRDREALSRPDLLGPRAFHRWLTARPHLTRAFFSRFALLPSPPQERARMRQALQLAAARGLQRGDRWFVLSQRWWDAWRAFVGFDSDDADADVDAEAGDHDHSNADEVSAGVDSAEAGSNGAAGPEPTDPSSTASSSPSSASAGAGTGRGAGRHRVRPTAIDNGALRSEQFDQELRPGLREGVDYTLLPAAAWALLQGGCFTAVACRVRTL